ncbi:RNA polymerase sigma factor [Bacillus phage W.Ph.]|uniref:Gp145 n=1 Tax=Bacillus phage W.Ph. TaxID=764595 RepID=G9B1P6_9CAUD|nr:RNA polymerase sigma factor [Bacillus phage W.Ph.]ADH03291.1 gp145 [Bacillus phage W.Ph.]
MIKHKELIIKAKGGDEYAMELLLSKYNKLMWSLINSHKVNRNNQDDAYQELSQCFIKVIHSFEPDRGFELATFLTTSMKGVLKNFMRDNKGFKIPSKLEPFVLKLRKIELEGKTNLELMRELGCTLDELQSAMSWLGAFKPMSMDEEVNTGKSNNVADVRLGDILSSGETLIDDKVALRDLIDRLPSKEKYIISRLYFDKEKQIDIANEMRVTKGTVRNIELDAIRNLRRMLDGDRAIPSSRLPKGPKGDKETAIELLKSGELKQTEISIMTGVPTGTLSLWASKIRKGEI